MATVGERIKEIREHKKLTQEQLSDAAGISKSFLSELENNKTNAGGQILLQIANVLGASVDYLLKGKSAELKSTDPVVIPPALSKIAGKLNLSYAETLELLEAHNSVVARRSKSGQKELSEKEWENFYNTIKKLFG